MVKCGGKQLNMHNSPSRNTSVVDRNLGLTQFETLMRHLLVVQLTAGGWKLERVIITGIFQTLNTAQCSVAREEGE